MYSDNATKTIYVDAPSDTNNQSPLSLSEEGSLSQKFATAGDEALKAIQEVRHLPTAHIFDPPLRSVGLLNSVALRVLLHDNRPGISGAKMSEQ